MVRVTNKRKHARYDGSGLWARLKVEGEFCEAQLENVSLGGALVTTRWSCAAGRNVLLELRGAQRDVSLVGRVIAVVPKGKGRTRPAARIKFNPSSRRNSDQLFALIRGLPGDDRLAMRPTDPEAFEFHELKFADPDDFEIVVALDDDERTARRPTATDEPTVRM